MTSEVLIINPRKKRSKRKTTRRKRRASPTRRRTVARKRTIKRRVLRAAPRRRTTTRRVSTMAKKRRTSRKKRSYRKNPSPRRYVKRAARSARTTFGSLDFKGVLKDVPYYQFGMFASKWLAKRFGGGASEIDPASWSYKEYLKGGLGAVAAAFLAQMAKPGSGKKVLAGGVNLMIYEMIQNELIAGNEWATGQFGVDSYYEGEDAGYQPGDVEQDETGQSYLLGEDLQWRALPEEGMQGALEPVGPLGQLEPVGPLGQLEPVGPLGASDPYRRALLDA